MSGWQTIESDPGVFTQLVKDLGVEGVQFEDISYLEQLLSLSSPLYGVVFLFPYEASRYASDSPIQGEFAKETPKSLFFAKQTIQNACGTQAVLNTLLSLAKKQDSQIRLGQELDGFLQFTSDFTNSALRGEAMSNSELIRTVHNSFTSPEPFESEQATQYLSSSNSELYHFVGFIPLEGHIFELDGLHHHPIVHKSYGADNNDPQTFAKNILSLLQERIDLMDISSQGMFSVMAIVHDKVEHFTKQLEATVDEDGNSYELQELLENELSQRDRWGREIALRRQNLYGLVCELSKQIIAKMSSNEFQERLFQAGKLSSQRRMQGYK